MEENIRPEAPPDLAAADGCAKELTRCNSDSSSLTVENSKDMLHQNANARPEQNRWDPNPSRKLPANACNASEQFMVLRNGSWHKMNFEENQPILDGAADSNVVESPWISRFRYAGKRSARTSADQQEFTMLRSVGMHSREERTSSHRIATSLDQIPVSHRCHQGSIDNITEVSDQNFVDEDREEESGSSLSTKRLRTAVADGSSQDQIVPSGKCMTKFSAASDDSLSERE